MMLSWWTHRESNSGLGNANAAVYPLPMGPLKEAGRESRMDSRPGCGPKGTRTPDLLHAMQTRYQLCHEPM